MQGCGVKRTARSRPFGDNDSVEGIDIAINGAFKGADIDAAVPSVSVFEEKAILG
jgi:hypothetical protein